MFPKGFGPWGALEKNEGKKKMKLWITVLLWCIVLYFFWLLCFLHFELMGG